MSSCQKCANWKALLLRLCTYCHGRSEEPGGALEPDPPPQLKAETRGHPALPATDEQPRDRRRVRKHLHLSGEQRVRQGGDWG